MTAGQRQSRRTQILLFACAWIVVGSLGLSAWTFVRQSQAETIRAADLKAQSSTKVSNCFQQVANAPAVIGALNLIDTLASNSIIANKAALATAAPGDPIRARAKASLTRLVPARKELRRLIIASEAKVPKIKACFTLAKQLDVDPKPFQPKTR